MAYLHIVKAITPSDVVAVLSNPTIKSRRRSPDYPGPYGGSQWYGHDFKSFLIDPILAIIIGFLM